MPPKLRKFLQSWLINTLAVLVAVYVVKGMRYEKPLDLLVASLVLGILNSTIRRVIVWLAFPLLIVTLGLFLLIINALVLYFVGFLLRPHFYVEDFRSAFWGALIISLVSLVLNTLTGTGGARFKIDRRRRPPDSDRGDGPVIDI
jgi:putative membrane protein